jgi:hypothetical protein
MSRRTPSEVRHMNSLIPNTKHCRVRPNGWWEFLLRVLPRLPWEVSLSPPECITLSDTEKAEALDGSLEAQLKPITVSSVQAVIEIFKWRLCFTYWSLPQKPINQPWRGSRSYHGSQRRQGSVSYRYSEQGLEAFSPASGILHCLEFLRDSLQEQCESSPELSSSLNRGTIQHCRHPIGPLVCWTRLANYLKRSYYTGS